MRGFFLASALCLVASVSVAEDSAITDELIAEALHDLGSMPETAPLDPESLSAFRHRVAMCWNTGGLSQDAQGIRTVVAFEMTPEARPVPDSIRLVESSDGSAEARGQAFEAARRAIVRCGVDGYGLPRESYAQWQHVQMVFDPIPVASRVHATATQPRHLPRPAESERSSGQVEPPWPDGRLAARSAESYDARRDLGPQIAACLEDPLLSEDRPQTAVTIQFRLLRNGRPDLRSFRLHSHDSGPEAAVSASYDAARLLVIRCGAGGFDLPGDVLDTNPSFMLPIAIRDDQP